MQELMSRHKAYALSPRDCLKTTLFQKWQRMVAPPGKLCWTTDDRKVLKEPNRIPDAQRPANKRRKRKGSSSGAGAGNAGPPAPSKKRSPGPNFSLASQVVSRICVFFYILAWKYVNGKTKIHKSFICNWPSVNTFRYMVKIIFIISYPGLINDNNT